MVHAFHMHQPAHSPRADASEHEAPARRLLARAVAFVLYFRAGGSFVLLFPCAGGADPSLVRDPCQAREQANNPHKDFLGSLRDDPKASQSHASTARYAFRSLNWPDNYDELSSPEQTAVRAAQDQKFMDDLMANNAAANEEAAATLALINAGTTTNSTDTPVRATKPGTEASAANPIDLTTPEGSPVAPTRLFSG